MRRAAFNPVHRTIGIESGKVGPLWRTCFRVHTLKRPVEHGQFMEPAGKPRNGRGMEVQQASLRTGPRAQNLEGCATAQMDQGFSPLACWIKRDHPEQSEFWTW